MMRFVTGSISPGVLVLLIISVNRGNVREAVAAGQNERKSGLLPLSGAFRAMHGPRSRSSQHQVSESLSGSLPVAVSTNAVPLGTAKFAPALTRGDLSVTAVTLVQALPAPEVTNALICSRLPEWK